MARRRRLPVALQYDLSEGERHSAVGEDSLVRKTHGEATVGDEATTESFRRKVQAMERREERKTVVETPAPAPTPPPAPRLSPSDVLRAAVYGDVIFSRPPGAAYFQRLKDKS